MKANTPLEQLMYNTNDIKMLKEKIHELYKCSIDLSNNSDSVSVSDTNLNTDVKDAYIIDTKGNLYKFIAFNENKDTAYIEYFTNLKGEKGDTGNTGATGADGQDGADGLSVRLYNGIFTNNSASYTKSSLADATNLQIGDIVIFKNGYLAKINTMTTTTFKVSNQELIEIEATTKGAFLAYSQPTISGDYLIYAPTAIYNSTANTKFTSGDLIIYVDSNDNPTEIYVVAGLSGDNLIVEKKAEYAKGKKLYQHNIVFIQRDNDYNLQIRANFRIINDDATPLNTNDLLVAYFQSIFGTHANDDTYTIPANGTFYLSGTHYNIHGVGVGDTHLDVVRFGFSTDAYNPGTFICYNQLSAYSKILIDNVVEL